MLHIYEGDGKGKTSAVIGLAVRAAGRGFKVLFVQFLKGLDTGETVPLETIGITVLRPQAGSKFVFQMSPEEKSRLIISHENCFEDIAWRVKSGTVDLLVLDEVLDAVSMGIIPLKRLISLLSERPPWVEVAVTGRNPPEELCKAADYYTLCTKLSHPYDKGILPRKGIEY